MDAKDIAILIASIGACLTSIIGAIFGGLAMLYAAKAKAEGAARDEKIEEVHKLVDGLATKREKDAGNKGFDAGEAGERNPTKQ